MCKITKYVGAALDNGCSGWPNVTVMTNPRKTKYGNSSVPKRRLPLKKMEIARNRNNVIVIINHKADGNPVRQSWLKAIAIHNAAPPIVTTESNQNMPVGCVSLLRYEIIAAVRSAITAEIESNIK